MLLEEHRATESEDMEIFEIRRSTVLERDVCAVVLVLQPDSHRSSVDFLHDANAPTGHFGVGCQSAEEADVASAYPEIKRSIAEHVAAVEAVEHVVVLAVFAVEHGAAESVKRRANTSLKVELLRIRTVVLRFATPVDATEDAGCGVQECSVDLEEFSVVDYADAVITVGLIAAPNAVLKPPNSPL